jgi:hypothetical protein
VEDAAVDDAHRRGDAESGLAAPGDSDFEGSEFEGVSTGRGRVGRGAALGERGFADQEERAHRGRGNTKHI